MIFVGIDLAGSPKRPTGICFINGKRARTAIAFSDDELRTALKQIRPTYVGIDAPIFLPLGRCCLRNDCTCPRDIHFRQCDLELRKRKIRFFPMTLGPMRQLTMRGMRLADEFRARGHTILETYPGAAQDLWGIPRQSNVTGLRRGLRRLASFDGRGISCHELDAITCALLAQMHHRGLTELIGREDEGWMVLPLSG
jgi:predicted nuclease with RNAse H fold